MNQLAETQKYDLDSFVDALAQCQNLQDSNIRDDIVKQLPPEIVNNIQRRSALRADILNIVQISQNYENGINQLLDVLRSYEGNSIQMQEVDTIWHSLDLSRKDGPQPREPAKIILRYLTVLILLLIPILLHLNRPERQIELQLVSRNFKMALDYQEKRRQMQVHSELLNDIHMDSKELSLEGFAPFSVYSENNASGETARYTVTSSSVEGDNTTINAIEKNFSITSVEYREQTQLSISVGKWSTTFDFVPVPNRFDSTWQVSMQVDFRTPFHIDADYRRVSAAEGAPKLTGNDLKKARFFIAKDANDKSFSKTFINHGKWFRMRIFKKSENPTIQLKNFPLFHFDTNRFDPDSRFDPSAKMDVSTLVSGSYQLLHTTDSEREPISSESTFKFRSKRLKLIGLKVKDDQIVSNILGTFSSFRIYQFGNYRELVPSYLSVVWASLIGKLILGIYILLFLRLLLGVKRFHSIMKILKYNPLR